MDFELTQRAELRPLPRIVPEQIFAGRILQMPLMELEHFLRAEFQENPALLMEEVEPDPAETPAPDVDDWEPTVATDHDEAHDPFRTVANPSGLREYLSFQCRTQLPFEYWFVGLDIIESLDDDGYFRDDLMEAADRHNLSIPEFETFLAAVQTLDPPGIAARDIRECLSIQVKRAPDAPPLAANLLEMDLWPDLVRRDVERLAKAAGETPEAVRNAIAWIQANLKPYPAHDYRPDFERLAPRKQPLERPDVIIRRNGDELWVECAGLGNLRLGLDTFYHALYRRIRRARGVSLTPDDRHVVEHVDRARLISRAVDLRGQTLYRIANHVVQFQRGLILLGPRHARPYMQKQVAEVLGIHESTVCRAVQGKLVQLPGGETVTFDYFFDAAMPVRDLVAEIIGHEDPRNPLNDGQVVEELKRQGITIARRTVAKYRDQMHILACELRRERA